MWNLNKRQILAFVYFSKYVCVCVCECKYIYFSMFSKAKFELNNFI